MDSCLGHHEDPGISSVDSERVWTSKEVGVLF